MEVAEKIVEKQSWIRFREMFMGDFDLFYLILFWVMMMTKLFQCNASNSV